MKVLSVFASSDLGRLMPLLPQVLDAAQLPGPWIAPKVGVLPDTLRGWVRRAEIDEGRRPGTTSSEAASTKALQAEVRELKRANEILLAASSFFARELDP